MRFQVALNLGVYKGCSKFVPPRRVVSEPTAARVLEALPDILDLEVRNTSTVSASFTSDGKRIEYLH
jgi:hypothetical protein